MVSAPNPVNALEAKRELEAAGRTVIVLNEFNGALPAEERRDVIDRFKAADPATMAMIHVAQITPGVRNILEMSEAARQKVEQSEADLGM